MIKTSRLLAGLLSLLAPMVALSPVAAADEIVWEQKINFSNFSDWGPSQRSGNINKAVADDFEVVGTISQVNVNGYGVRTQDAAFTGIYISFFAYGADDKPGALQSEIFVPKGDPRILNQFSSSDFQVALGTPFQATGKHFISVQAGGTAEWYWRSANEDAPRGPALYYRANATSQWTHKSPLGEVANADVAMTLFGTRVLTGPTISSLSASTLPQAGRLIINGSGFGEEQNDGVVEIGGANAPVADWTEDRIVAYVPDAAPLGSDNVQVITSGGSSNTVPLVVTARPPQSGHVKWRLQIDDLFIISRPMVAPDGTIYAVSNTGHLYAVTPAGGVKWIYNVDKPNALQPVGLGPDGTIYFAINGTIYAVNPDGTLKWTFSDPEFWRIFAGPTVGPDGNIYGATENGDDPNGLGAFVVSPAGNLISNLHGFYTRAGYGAIEIVFGAQGHWYFTTNASGAIIQAGSLFAFNLGTTNLDWSEAAMGQPRLQPNGNIVVGDGYLLHPGLQNFTPEGALVWRSLGELPGSRAPGIDAQTSPDVGPDGNIYSGTLIEGTGRQLTSLDADGFLRWQFTEPGIASNPGVNLQNTVVLFSAYDINAPSRVHALTTDGALLWTEHLPAENDGYVHVTSQPRFSPDGNTAYVGTDVNSYALDPYCYLYAFDTSADDPPPADTITITAATYKVSRSQLTVSATSTGTDVTLQVFETSTNNLIGTLTKAGTRYTGKFSYPSNPVNITVRSNLGGEAAKQVRAR